MKLLLQKPINESGPIRPINIVIMIKIFPPNERNGVIPIDTPTVPKADVDVQNGSFKVFTKINDEIKWSESFSYKPKFSDSSSNKSITLYAEAPEMGEQEPANSNALPVINENEL